MRHAPERWGCWGWAGAAADRGGSAGAGPFAACPQPAAGTGGGPHRAVARCPDASFSEPEGRCPGRRPAGRAVPRPGSGERACRRKRCCARRGHRGLSRPAGRRRRPPRRCRNGTRKKLPPGQRGEICPLRHRQHQEQHPGVQCRHCGGDHPAPFLWGGVGQPRPAGLNSAHPCHRGLPAFFRAVVPPGGRLPQHRPGREHVCCGPGDGRHPQRRRAEHPPRRDPERLPQLHRQLCQQPGRGPAVLIPVSQHQDHSGCPPGRH